MTKVDTQVSDMITNAMLRVPPSERPDLARKIAAHAAAGLAIYEGSESAAEALYRLADAIIARRALEEELR